jgi:hypothetical protein
MFCWETGPGYAVHLLNYTNPDAQHGWLREVDPLEPQPITMRVPSGVTIRSVELLKAKQRPPFIVHEQLLRFTVPALDDYEVAAITVI